MTQRSERPKNHTPGTKVPVADTTDDEEDEALAKLPDKLKFFLKFEAAVDWSAKRALYAMETLGWSEDRVIAVARDYERAEWKKLMKPKRKLP